MALRLGRDDEDRDAVSYLNNRGGWPGALAHEKSAKSECAGQACQQHAEPVRLRQPIEVSSRIPEQFNRDLEVTGIIAFAAEKDLLVTFGPEQDGSVQSSRTVAQTAALSPAKLA